MSVKPANITLLRLQAIYDKYTTKGVRKIVCNEGGSRSAKTWDTLYFFLWYCSINAGKGKRVRVFRETLVSCRSSVYEDFKNILTAEGLFDPNYSRESPAPRYELFGNTVYFHGLDDWTKVEGLPSDVLFFNEALEIDRRCFDTLLMRCTELCIMDWNPRYTEHWCFELEKRDNTIFCHSTFRDNHYLSDSVRKGIEAYEPTPENIERGTADEWRWKVYGLGVRAAQEGLIYTGIDWIDAFPDTVSRVAFGLDFGFTNDPTALVRVGAVGHDLYVACELYQPVADVNTLYQLLAPIVGGTVCYADSADRYAKNPESMIVGLNMRGLRVVPVKKYAGSITDGIEQVKAFRLHFVKSKPLLSEANAYAWATVNGIRVNVPQDAFNHAMDAMRYAVMTYFYYATDWR